LIILLFLSSYCITENVDSLSDINPSQLSIDISDYTPKEGEEVTVTLTEVPYNKNAEYKDINGFYVDVYYGTKSQKDDSFPGQIDYILEDKFYRPDNENDEDANEYWVTFSFVPSRDGKITIEYISHRHYDVNEKYIEISCIPKSEDTSNNNTNTPGFEVFLLLCGILFIFIMKKQR